MRFSVVRAAAFVGGVIASASLSQAAFTILATPAAGTNAPATAGLSALLLNAKNDVGGADGDKLQAIKIVFTGTNGTKVFFNTKQNRTPDDPETEEDESVPIPNSYSANPNNYTGDGELTFVNREKSNLRIGSGATTFADNPGDADTVLTEDQHLNGVSTFSADYAALSSAAAVNATGATGARFARLVFNTLTPTFTAKITIAGETGPGVEQTFFFPFHTPPNQPPVVAPSAVTVVFGPVVSNGAPFSAQVTVTDVQFGLITLAAPFGVPASISGLTIAPAGGSASPATFTVSGTVAYLPFGTIVNILLVATDAGGLTSEGVLVLTITPEPTSLVALAGVVALGAMRRRR